MIESALSFPQIEARVRMNIISGRRAARIALVPQKNVVRDWLWVATPGVSMDSYANPSPTRALIRDTVLNVAKLSLDEFVSGRRYGYVVQARFAFYWLCAKHTKSSYPAIGRMAGNRDHTTVMAAFASKTMQQDRVLWIIKMVQKALNLEINQHSLG